MLLGPHVSLVCAQVHLTLHQWSEAAHVASGLLADAPPPPKSDDEAPWAGVAPFSKNAIARQLAGLLLADCHKRMHARLQLQ